MISTSCASILEIADKIDKLEAYPTHIDKLEAYPTHIDKLEAYPTRIDKLEAYPTAPHPRLGQILEPLRVIM